MVSLDLLGNFFEIRILVPTPGESEPQETECQSHSKAMTRMGFKATPEDPAEPIGGS